MAIIRGHHSFEQHFTQIPNDWVRDTRLSLKAIGLLVQLMSHTPGWNMSIRSLARANDCGTETIKSAIEELEKFGYLIRSEQKHNVDGRFSDFDYTTCDPSEVTQNPVTVKPRHGEIGHKEQQPIKEQQKPKNTQENLDNDFESFWLAYPLKVGKQAARKSFAKAVASVGVDVLVAGAKRYCDDPNRVDAFTKHPATWLNAGCWSDSPLPPRKLSNEESLADRSEMARRERERAILATEALLAEQKEQEKRIAENPPEKCVHGRIAVICVKCN